ncbi:diguanylate cyclase [Deinococcus pimensis]|uniref:diguanylate cyclase n=1 Tax=Deinococcus pimensis TaxID=309888 RepID=UPI000488CC9E|nr:diguanylate cyclase [Deinococcus pimensis]
MTTHADPHQATTERLHALLEHAHRTDLTPEERRALLQHAHEQSVVTSDEARTADLERALADLCDPTTALSYARAAARRYETLGETWKEACALLRESELELDDLAALRQALAAGRLARNAGHPDLELRALHAAASAYATLGHPGEAAATLQLALTLDAAASEREQARLLLDLATALHEARDLAEARATYLTAAKRFPAVSGEHRRALTGLGEVLLEQGDAARAAAFLERAADVASHLRDDPSRQVAQTLAALAQVLASVEVDEARVRQAISLARSCPPALALRVILGLARHALTSGRADLATPLAAHLTELLHANVALLDRAEDVERLLADLAEDSGDLRAALDHQRLSAEHRLARRERELARERDLLAARYDVELQLAARRERASTRTRAPEASSTPLPGGARSREYGLEQLQRDYRRCLRAKTDLGVAVVGLDIESETSGADAARLHAAFTTFLVSTLRDTDTVADFDGRRLLVVLPETGPVGARQVMQRLLQRALERAWCPADLSPPFQVSVGLCNQGFVQGARLILESADEQYYRARREGGDRVCAAE